MASGGDRLSALPDEALVRILSHLVTDEAVRTSANSSRWRYVHEGVPVIALVDTRTCQRVYPMDDLKVCFDHQVACAILGKGVETPIRVLRLSGVLDAPYDLLDQWIATAVTSGVEDLDVKLSYRTLRRLCLTCCWALNLPGSVDMASLETLHLAMVTARDGLLQQLLSSCPRLANLTLEECASVKEITVTSPCLRKFTMICCHNATAVELHTTCLRSLHYEGGLPPPGSPFIAVANYLSVAAVRIEICRGSYREGPPEVAPIMTLVSRCEKLARLDLRLGLSVDYYSSLLTSVVRDLPHLKHVR
ncbi:hypothetical protein D1007_50671 [Hordeum vulgare]|uniref:F-box domain-containing protein n=1 Tax=Hordeum vulgare subsp. vulgare TaxID=112509 RepID=A0A8I6WY62_HORVV|nr:hypothetical protein D1007_50671 [Hordeum vulgare]